MDIRHNLLLFIVNEPQTYMILFMSQWNNVCLHCFKVISVRDMQIVDSWKCLESVNYLIIVLYSVLQCKSVHFHVGQVFISDEATINSLIVCFVFCILLVGNMLLIVICFGRILTRIVGTYCPKWFGGTVLQSDRCSPHCRHICTLYTDRLKENGKKGLYCCVFVADYFG